LDRCFTVALLLLVATADVGRRDRPVLSFVVIGMVVAGIVLGVVIGVMCASESERLRQGFPKAIRAYHGI
jgi:hypothetical protein